MGAGGVFVSILPGVGLATFGVGAGVTGLAGSSGLQPLISAAHRPMLATSASAWNLNVLVTMLLLRGVSDGQGHPKVMEKPKARASGPHAKTTVRAMTCHTCTAAYYSCLSRYHQRTSAFSGRKTGAAHEVRQEPASSGLEGQTKRSFHRRGRTRRHWYVRKTIPATEPGDRLCRSCLTELQKKLKFCDSIDRRSQMKCQFVFSRPSSRLELSSLRGWPWPVLAPRPTQRLLDHGIRRWPVPVPNRGGP